VLVGLEGVFDERRPLKGFDCGVVEVNKEAIVYAPATEYTEEHRAAVKSKVTRQERPTRHRRLVRSLRMAPALRPPPLTYSARRWRAV